MVRIRVPDVVDVGENAGEDVGPALFQVPSCVKPENDRVVSAFWAASTVGA
jgi:hypothetical protein